MLTIPCGDHTQLSSFNPGNFSYFPSTTRTCHSTREKFILHDSPSAGRPFPLRSTNADQGRASSTDQPLSRSRGSFNVPSIATADLYPGISHELSAFPPLLYAVGRNRSHPVFSALISNSKYF